MRQSESHEVDICRPANATSLLRAVMVLAEPSRPINRSNDAGPNHRTTIETPTLKRGTGCRCRCQPATRMFKQDLTVSSEVDEQDGGIPFVKACSQCTGGNISTNEGAGNGDNVRENSVAKPSVVESRIRWSRNSVGMEIEQILPMTRRPGCGA